MARTPSEDGAAWRPWAEELRATVQLALPLIALQLGQIAINATDVLMIGRLGPEALAAGALGSHFFIAVWLFCLGVLQAIAPLAAQAKGRRNPKCLRRTVRQGFWVAGLLSLPACLLLWHTREVLLLLGQSGDNAAAAGGYIQAMLWGFLPSMGYTVLRGFLSALSRPRAAMVAMLLSVLLNILLDYALIFGNFGLPRLELVGAGVASALVHSCMFVGLLVWTLGERKLKRYHLTARFWRADWARFREIFRIGLPIGATLLAESGLFAIATFLMGLIGTGELAAHAIAMQCAAITFMVPLGIGYAGTVRVGLAFGRQDCDGAGRAGWTALGLGTAFMSLTALLFVTLPQQIVGLYLDLENPASLPVLRHAVDFLFVAAVFQLADGAQVVANSALRGLSDTRVPMWLSLFGYWGVGLGLAVVFAFPLGFGGVGVWYGMAAGLTVTAICSVWRFHRRESFCLARMPLTAAPALTKP